MRATAVLAILLAAGTLSARADQVINDDLIVDGSACVGFDCVNGESFGFDTIRLKENNLRIRFFDTSSSASFPTRDWQITANETSNGGANKFSIDDIDAGRTPFTIEADAPSHSLYVDDGGRIGLGTSTPVVEVHLKDGDTPTHRLEQDGSSGFTAQTWDVAGNETNFFIRDATNGSKLPFRIRPNAPSNSIFVDNDGDIGMNTSSPQTALHVSRSGASNRAGLRLESKGDNTDNNPAVEFRSTANASAEDRTWRFGQGAGGALFMSTGTGSGLSGINVNRLTLNTAGNLSVTGTISSGGTTLIVPDYVFQPEYQLLPLTDLEAFIRQNRHLPDIPSKEEIRKAGGVNMTEMQMKLLEKVEQLTLYTLEQQKTIEGLRTRLANLEQRGDATAAGP